MHMNIFEGDAFTLDSLTSAINNLPHKPGRIGALKLFKEKGIRTTKVSIEERDGVLYLVPSLPRGGVPKPHPTSRRRMRSISTVHLPTNSTVMAASIQDVRRFGTESDLQIVQEVVNDRLAEMRRSLEATIEWQKLGALKGRVLDADGSEILDLFTLFDVEQPAEVDFDLDNPSPLPGAIRGKCSKIIRDMEDELGDQQLGGVSALTGSAFFDALVDHPELREAYERYNAGEALRDRTARRSFFYAGITFEEYRGKVGATQFVDDDKAHFFPTGTDDVFVTVFAPGNFIDQANELGLPLYARSVPDKAGRWVELLAESNPLSYCTRPRTLIQGKRT